MKDNPLYVLTDMDGEVVAITEDLDTAKRYSFFRTHRFCNMNLVLDKTYKQSLLTEHQELFLVYVDTINKFVTERDYRMYFQDIEIVSADLAVTRSNIENIILNSTTNEFSNKDIKALVRTVQIINGRMRECDSLMEKIEGRLK